MKIAILGAGAYGTALGQVLIENGHEIEYYDPFLSNTSLKKVLNKASFVLLAVPSGALHDILPKLPKDTPMIVTTKGILDDNTLSGFKDIMVLSGPGFADDIKAHKKTLLTSSDERIDKLFTTDYLTFDHSNDNKGILMCGALKNAYAVGAGLDDLKSGTPEHEIFLQKAVVEMKAILLANNANPSTVDLSCGKDDLKLTCDYPSRNYDFGQKVRKDPNYRPENTVEGINTLKKIRNGEIKVPKNVTILKDLLDRSKHWD